MNFQNPLAAQQRNRIPSGNGSGFREPMSGFIHWFAILLLGCLVDTGQCCTRLPADHGQKAEAALRAEVADNERKLGAEDPDTLTSRFRLAEFFRHGQRLAEAEAEHRTVLTIRERVLIAGPEHYDSLQSRDCLAYVLNIQGKFDEAEAEYRKVLALREHRLGAGHSRTRGSRHTLAFVLAVHGKHAEAEAEWRVLLAIRERGLGAWHPQVAETCYRLALSLEAQAKGEKAVPKLTEALALMQRAAAIHARTPTHVFIAPDLPADVVAQFEAALAAAKAREAVGGK